MDFQITDITDFQFNFYECITDSSVGSTLYFSDIEDISYSVLDLQLYTVLENAQFTTKQYFGYFPAEDGCKF